jgi:propionyl-CoA carboxylase beta chain
MKLGRLNHIGVATPTPAVIASEAYGGAYNVMASKHLRGEYEERFANPFVAASKGFIDEVIYPHSTRRRIALGLRKLRNKGLENPWKKHDNIPL